MLLTISNAFKIAAAYANIMSGCNKVKVGAVLLKDGHFVGIGANRAVPDYCHIASIGCMREAKYGDNSKSHRNPEDCRAVHAEIDAIISSARDLHGATICVTRYPCEACARAIVLAGISKVVYGREQSISEETDRIFDSAGVEVVHNISYKEDDVLR